MNTWKNEMLDLLSLLLGRPETTTQYVIAGIAGLIAFVVVMKVAANIMDAGRSSVASVLLVLLPGIFITLAAVTATRLYALPHIPAKFHILTQACAAAVAILLIAVPIQCLIQKINYIKALIATALSVIAAGALIALVNVIYGSISTGEGQFKQIKGRKDATEIF